ncbi:sugar ABC transporter substrate-binding protein [Catellatospora sp. TT07R-123]|uniref:sugar ABC transporter substrate-binding protein n=1 Tax=Catellatospora sp. TT07R-123 TaxID=2733863 RepID=UPI001B27B5A8|nr:sugar ABC transporter substrate-binding protein [Catellatospora sp. TT07R-123]GHJ43690.1 sugar ABC transporter substrate-binding protein [Catellatospora sp. TT07R-123]
MLSRKATRLVAALAVTFALATVTGCGEDQPAADSKAPLEIWVRKPPGSPTEKTHQDLAAKFTAATGVPTRVTAVFEDFETKLQQAAAQKKLPDIVVNDTAQLGTLVKQGLVRDVNQADIAGGDQLTPASWDAARGADGKLYAVPFSAQSFALFIRKDWRERLGLAQPTSWAELDALATAFTTKDPDGNGKADTYGYVIPGSTKRGYLDWYFSSFLWASGADYFSGSPGSLTPAIGSDQAVGAATWLKSQFCTAKSVVPGAVTAETTQAHPLFETGKGGVYFTGPYNMARFDKSLGKDKYEVVALPAGPGGKSASLAEGENVYLMAGSANPAGQERFAEFLISEQGQTIGMAGDTDGNVVRLPVNKNIDLAKVRTDARWLVFDKVYKEVGRYAPVVPEWTPFRTASAEALNAIVSNCASDPKAELAKLATEFGAELKKQGAGA